MNQTRRLLFCGIGLWATVTAAAAENMIGNCVLTGTRGSIPIAAPAAPDQLTVQVSLPAPIWWDGDKPEAIHDGMEYCMAAEIAWRAGYDKLNVVSVDWTQLVSGKTSGYDLTLSEASITAERKKVVDFSIPYFNSDIGVLATRDAPVDEKSIKAITVGIQQGTTGAAFALDVLHVTNYEVYAERSDLFNALHQGDVQAIMTDTAITLSQEVVDAGKTKVVGQYKTGETYGAIYPKGNANNATIDKIIQSMIDDGTLKKLTIKYLASAWGKDPATIPYFNP